MPTETEVKLAVASAAAARGLLRAKGYRVSKPRIFEANDVFDTPDRRLRDAQSLLRVRQVRREAKLTYKGPPSGGKHKSREELELKADDAQTLASILGRLGFARVFRYEKYRTEFQRETTGTVTLDETPIGTYLELEGAPGWIDRTARALGFEEKDYILESYGRLYLTWCERQGREPGDMVFGKRGGQTR
ncbi:MAG TPA: class IV adenylate cyclase [Bryobacteraceae bacterium]|nr:class IV adenylate cyclase [Bryobacteraceae bacterium]